MNYAKDYECVKCGKQAVAFWPVIDPDIPSSPYCRKCLDEAQTRVLLALLENDDSYLDQE
jgi:hypothetical protein